MYVLKDMLLSKEVTTTVMWFNERDLDIIYVQCQVYDIKGETYLDIEQVIPLPSASATFALSWRHTVKSDREYANVYPHKSPTR